MKLCDACLQGPTGSAGHQDLHYDELARDEAVPDLPPVFVCGACRAEWVRHPSGSGYSWESI